jgi:transcriptional/translational regulatory protein YebC/TACO1
MDTVSRALQAQGFVVKSAQQGYRAKNPITLGEAERAEVAAFPEALDDDDVQSVYAGLSD